MGTGPSITLVGLIHEGTVLGVDLPLVVPRGMTLTCLGQQERLLIVPCGDTLSVNCSVVLDDVTTFDIVRAEDRKLKILLDSRAFFAEDAHAFVVFEGDLFAIVALALVRVCGFLGLLAGA